MGVFNLLKTSIHSLFLNSVPLSVRIFLEGPKGLYMWFKYALITSYPFLDLIGMQNVKPGIMQTAVKAYLLPLLDTGWNYPVKSC